MAGSCWVGLDYGHVDTSVTVVNEYGRVVLATTCKTEARAIVEVLRAIPGACIEQVGLEAGVGVHLARELRALGLPVLFLEARKASHFLQVSRIKSDATDARGLAELTRIGRSIVPDVHVKSLECQNIRSRLTIRQKLVRQCQALEALINALVRLHGGDLQLGRNQKSIAYRLNREMCRLAYAGINTDEDVRPILAIRDAMREQLRAIDRRIVRDAGRNEVCQRLMTVPGIGALTALSFYSTVENPDRFPRVAGIGPYLGLAPGLRQSGQMARSGPIDRRGDSLTRSNLVIAATTLLYHKSITCPLRDWGRRLLEKAGPGKARIAVARKLAVVMLRIWKDRTTFDASAGLPLLRGI